VGSVNSAIAALWIGIGIAAIAVGALSVVNEFRNRRGWH
jgi:uncharacterized membrane protein HdeD (DUF308 family)